MKKIILSLSTLLISIDAYSNYNSIDWTINQYTGVVSNTLQEWTGSNFNGVNLTLNAQISTNASLMSEAVISPSCSTRPRPQASNVQYVYVNNKGYYTYNGVTYEFDVTLPSGEPFPPKENTQYAHVYTTYVTGANCNNRPYRPTQTFTGSMPVTLVSNTNLPISNTPHRIQLTAYNFSIRNGEQLPTSFWFPLMSQVNSSAYTLTYLIKVVNTCAVDQSQLDFNFGALPFSAADQVSKSLDLRLRCTHPGNIKLTYTPSAAYDGSNATRTDLGLGWYGELSVNDNKQTEQIFTNVTDETLNINVRLGKKEANPSVGNLNGGGVLIFEYI